MSATPEPAEETYLAQACRLVAEHAELFRAPAPRIVRLLPPLRPQPPRRANRSQARQLRLPLAPTMPR